MRAPSLPVVLVLMSLLVACGRFTDPPTSWVGTSDREATFIQFTQVDNAMQGTFDETTLKEGAAATESHHVGFTGTVVKSHVTLTLSYGLGATLTLTGTLSPSAMKLEYPDSATGSLMSSTLRPGNVAKYNKAAGKLATKAEDNRRQAEQLAAAEQKRAEQAAEQERAEARLATASNAVSEDVAALEHTLSASVSFKYLDSVLAEAKTNLAAGKKAAEKAAAGGENGCYEADNAGYYANSVDYDVNSMDYEAQGVASTAEKVDRLLTQLAADYRALQDLMSVGPPDAGDVESIQKRASTAAAGWRSKVADYQGQVKQIAGDAHAVADAAKKSACG